MADFCPHCSADLWGGPIPEAIREHYSPPYRWRRDIGISDRDADRIVAWECHDCHKRWSATTTVSSTERCTMCGGTTKHRAGCINDHSVSSQERQ